MLDTTVDPADIDEGARAWAQWNRLAADIITRWTSELRQMVSAGWRGGSADAALGSLGPVDNWAYGLSDNGEHTARLLDGSGYSAGQAKVAVPPAESHDWGRSLTSFGLGGPGFALVDAVAQDRAQAEAHAEAIRVMNSVYSAPINENRSAIQPAAQLADPTLQPPEPSPGGGPQPGAYPLGPGGSGGGGSAGLPPQAPSAVGLQNVTGGGSPGSVDSGQYGPAQPTGPRHLVGGQGGHGPGVAAASAVPFIPPMAGGGTGTGNAAERAGRGFRGAGQIGGRPGSAGNVGARPGGPGGGANFGPRGSGGVTAGPGMTGVGEGRAGGAGMGGAGAAGRGGGGLGGVPVGGAGAGRGQGGEDTEHQRPSWLIEMNDIFSDGRKVAPPVIGEDPPEHYR